MTGLQAQLTFHDPDHLFPLLPLPIQGTHLCGAAAESVGRLVFAAVSHDKDFEASRQRACRLQVGLLQIAPERTSLEAPILLELAHEIPARITEPLEQLLRGIPRVAEDNLGLAAQAIARIARQFEGQIELRGAAFVPAPKGQGAADLPVRPAPPDDCDAKDDSALFTRPHPRGVAEQSGRRFFHHRVIPEELAASDREQCPSGQVEE